MMHRRHFLRGLVGAGAFGGWRPALAAPAEGHKFVFVLVRGGWDTTRVFSTGALNHTATEPDATDAVEGGLSFVDHPSRPEVRDFFAQYAQRSVILDGLLVPSVNHRVCERLIFSGTTRADAADWPSLLGADWADRVPMPTVVLDGPSLPGPHGRTVTISGSRDQLQQLLDGRFGGDQQAAGLAEAESQVDALVRARAVAHLQRTSDPAERRMVESWLDGRDRALQLRGQVRDVSARNFTTQIRSAVSLLETGISRCVCLSTGGWDTHGDNDIQQSALFSELFVELRSLMDQLQAAPGYAGSLADETTVVVVSEMGRTPFINSKNGKDHWQWSSAMLIGAGVAGGRRIGGMDDNLNGLPVSLGGSQTPMTTRHLGATLLALGNASAERPEAVITDALA